MIVGEAPGREEDIGNKPFIGTPGDLLSYVLERLGIDRTQVYITNAVKCRPPNNKLPTRREEKAYVLKRCRKYLNHEIHSVRPKALLALGVTALQAVTGEGLVAKWQSRYVCEYEGAAVYCGYHPSYILRNRWEERKLVLAISLAANAAGIPCKVQLTGKLFEYDDFR